MGRRSPPTITLNENSALKACQWNYKTGHTRQKRAFTTRTKLLKTSVGQLEMTQTQSKVPYIGCVCSMLASDLCWRQPCLRKKHELYNLVKLVCSAVVRIKLVYPRFQDYSVLSSNQITSLWPQDSHVSYASTK